MGFNENIYKIKIIRHRGIVESYMKKQIDNKKKAKKSKKDVLSKELKSLIKEINEEGLIFLIKQAHVIIHNQQVSKFNEKMENLNEMDKKSKKKSPGKAKSGNKLQVNVEEAGNGKHFILVAGTKRKMLALDEMRKLVNICSIAKNKTEASARLFNWFSRNRTDILMDLGIKSKLEPVLADIHKFLKKNYEVKKK